MTYFNWGSLNLDDAVLAYSEGIPVILFATDGKMIHGEETLQAIRAAGFYGARSVRSAMDRRHTVIGAESALTRAIAARAGRALFGRERIGSAFSHGRGASLPPFAAAGRYKNCGVILCRCHSSADDRRGGGRGSEAFFVSAALLQNIVKKKAQSEHRRSMVLKVGGPYAFATITRGLGLKARDSVQLRGCTGRTFASN